jgi:hypothetical protein
MATAQAIVWLLAAYSAAGGVFAVAFVMTGIDLMDEAARRSGWGFRLMVIPGTAALWPFLLIKWSRARRMTE